jgi:alpha-ribazole phosphatase
MLAESKCYPQPDQVLISPMGRCRESAGILYPGQQLLEVPEWCEMDFGHFEMKNYEELNGDPDYQRWIDSGGTLAFPGGESREAFVRRAVCGMENVTEYLSQLLAQKACPDCGGCTPGLRVAAVVHGGTIMALLSHYCGGDYFDYQVENAKGYHCRLRLCGETIEMEITEKL